MKTRDVVEERLSAMPYGREPLPWSKFIAGHKEPYEKNDKHGPRGVRVDGYTFGPYLVFTGKEHRSMRVNITHELAETLARDLVVPGELHLEAVERDDGSVLLVAAYGHIIASRWIGFIDPATIPPRLELEG